MKKIAVGHRVSVLRNITRVEGPYALAGETGEVIETFQPQLRNENPDWFAKVKMDAGPVKTFRITSLKRES